MTYVLSGMLSLYITTATTRIISELSWGIGQTIAIDMGCLYLTPSFG